MSKPTKNLEKAHQIKGLGNSGLKKHYKEHHINTIMGNDAYNTKVEKSYPQNGRLVI